MRKILFASLLVFMVTGAFSQVTYIGIINHNTGTGFNNLFNNYVAAGQQCYIDWEVYAEGMTNMEACGFRSVSRLVLRRKADNDTTSVIASAPVIVPGICGGKNGNNDHYYVELSSYIDKPGRYSVEIQADLPNMTYPFENATTKTTCNYSCPSAYYLTGTGGPTGSYYTPSGSCTGGPGLSDPVGGQGADMLAEIFPALKFFTVGEVGAYREMVVFNGSFYDLPTGKFQPGNPALPASLDGTNGIPANGICANGPVPQLSIGGEVNTFKRTDCGNADVTFASLFYRLYKRNTPASAYAAVALNFKDDCPFSSNGPEGNIFPNGGSCQNANGILDQRWQTIVAEPNILPQNFPLSDTGIWNIEFYTQVTVVTCTGTVSARVGDTTITTFTVADPQAPGSSCTVTPVILSAFTVAPSVNNNLLNWIVEEASQVNYFEVQRSFDGFTFSTIASVPYLNGRSSFDYKDAAFSRTVFYRLIVHEQSGQPVYSFIVKVNSRRSGIKLTVQPSSQNMGIQLENCNKGKYGFDIINTAGNLMARKTIQVPADGNTDLIIIPGKELAHGVYYGVLRDEKGEMIAKTNFYY